MLGKRFRTREDAGSKLAAVLDGQSLKKPLVLGIPRGGMVVAARVAKSLAAELGAVVSKKLLSPYQPELALGAVTGDGFAYIDSVLAEEVGASRQYLLEEENRQTEQAKLQQELLDGSRRVSFEGREALVIDDGLATAASAITVVRRAWAAGAVKVIVAAPVAPPDALELLRSEATEVICLLEAPGFISVSQYYDHFRPVDDEAIRALLKDHRPA